MKCAARCDREAEILDWCKPHYNKAHRLGVGDAGKQRRVDPAQAISHVSVLRARGWTWRAIGEAAGLAMSVPHQMVQGRHPKIALSSARALLAITPTWVESRILVDPAGTRRRVDALAYLGWPLHVVEERAGFRHRTVSCALSRGRVTALIASRVARVYDDLHILQGASRCAAGRAKARGVHPPAAWDYVDIDDPKAKPFQGFYSKGAA